MIYNNTGNNKEELKKMRIIARSDSNGNPY